MEEPSADVLELYTLLDKLNCETDKTIERINAIKHKGAEYVKKADAVVGSEPKKKIIQISREYLKQICSRVAEINSDLELEEDIDESTNIPYLSERSGRVELKFLSAQNPWDFWLYDENIDKNALQKLLLKKYQNNLFDVYKTPKLQDSVCFLERNKCYRGMVVQVVNADKLKVQDCDSNSCRVVSRDKVFKVDPDACDLHASALHCTISQNAQEKLWDPDLQALFCDILKEALLSVQILERLPTNIPSFKVDVEIDDDGNKASLNSWIEDRLLPQVKKLKHEESDNVYEFLSSEVTNPYHSENMAKETDNSDVETDLKMTVVSNTKPEVKATDSANQNPKVNVTNISNKECDLKVTNNSNRESKVKVSNKFHSNTALKLVQTLNQETEVTETKSSIQETVLKNNNKPNRFDISKQTMEIKTENFEDAVSSSNDSVLINNLDSPRGKTSVVAARNIELNDIKKTNNLDNTNVTTSNAEEETLSASSSGNASSSNNEQLSRSNSVESTTDSVRSLESLQSSKSNEIRPESLPLVTHRPIPPVPVDLFNLSMTAYGPGQPYYPPQPMPRAPYQPQYQPHMYQPPAYPPYSHPAQYGYGVYQGPPISYTPTMPKYRPQPPPPQMRTYIRPVTPQLAQEYPIPSPPAETAPQLSRSSSNVSVGAREFVPQPTRQSKENLSSQSTAKEEENRASPPPDPDKTYHFDLKNPTSLLKPNENLRVVVTHIVSPSKFYVNFSNTSNQLLKKLQGDMMVYYSKRQSVGYKTWQQAKKSLGKFCVAKWSNDHFYRVEILDWALGDDQVRVFFVDYGRTMELHLNCLQPLTQKFAKLSMCAQRCHLAKVQPPNGQKGWPEDSIEAFKLKVTEDEVDKYTITVIPVKKEELTANSLSVMLYYEPEGAFSLCVNDYMKNCSRARSSRPNKLDVASSSSVSSASDVYQSPLEISPLGENPILAEPLLSPEFFPKLRDKPRFDEEIYPPRRDEYTNGLAADGWDLMSADYYGSRNNSLLDTDDAGVALTGYKAMDEARACKFGVSCRKVNCRKEHIELRPDGVTTDQTEVFVNFKEINLPDVGEIIRVKVTAVEDVDLFYIQLEEAKGIAPDDEDRQTISQLTESMNNPESVRKMKRLTLSPALGELVLAHWQGRWHRGRVTDIDSSDDVDQFPKFEVCFIDYGSVATLEMTDLRMMEPQYSHLPIQSIECRLANIESPVIEHLRNQATELLEVMILNQTCIAKVYDSVERNALEVFLMIDGVDIGEFLVNNEAVEPKFVDWPPPRNMSVRVAPG